MGEAQLPTSAGAAESADASIEKSRRSIFRERPFPMRM
jgi:hypothetical protein